MVEPDRRIGDGKLSYQRTWLYRVATSRCLDVLCSARRRPLASTPPEQMKGLEPPEPTRLGELLWLEPCPDALLEHLADTAPGPEARYEARESISLAFITALQLLPARQRAAVILRDVLGFRASEAARILDTSQEPVTSALKRARATLQRHQRSSPQCEPAPPPGHPDRAAALEPGQALPGRQQGLLQRILGVQGRAEDPVAVHLQLAPVGIDQFAERLPVAGPGPVYQIRAHRTTLSRPRPLPSPTATTSTDTTRAGNWAAPAAANSGCSPVSTSLTARTG
jgi:RNA polymerase sigma factor (sigma-70 family)